MRTYRTFLLRLQLRREHIATNLFMDDNTLFGWFAQVFRVVEVVTSCHAIQPCYVSVYVTYTSPITWQINLYTYTDIITTPLPNVLPHSRTVQEDSVMIIVGLVINVLILPTVINVNK